MAKQIRFKTTDPRAFAAALERESRQLFPRYVAGHVFGLTKMLYSGILNLTPVYTGRARVNWNVTYGSPSTKVIDGDQNIDIQGYWFKTTGAPLTSTENTTIEAMKERILKGAKKVFITNNLSYIFLLEQGIGSQKAPFGMVEITMDYVLTSTAKTKIHNDALRLL